MFWAGSRAELVGRQNLRLEPFNLTVRWLGRRGMQWTDLKNELQWICLHRVPKMIIIHTGGNNVIGTPMQKMKRLMAKDFSYLFHNLPETLIVWSEILPRLSWKFSTPGSDLEVIDKKRKRFNKLGRQMVHDHPHGHFIIHDITTDTPGLFLQDGCHLSDVGLDLFCNSFQGAIETFITSGQKSFGP